MTRQEAIDNLTLIGVSEPSDEQITKYLNQVHGESNKERERAEGYKKDADKAAGISKKASDQNAALQSKIDELQGQLDEINARDMSDVDKAHKETEDAKKEAQKALDKIAELEKEIARKNTLQSLADKGIVGEDASNLIKEDGTVDFDTLGKIISDREAAAATAKEQEIARNASNPVGGKASEPPVDEKPADVENAESLSFGVANNSAKAARDYYK